MFPIPGLCLVHPWSSTISSFKGRSDFILNDLDMKIRKKYVTLLLIFSVYIAHKSRLMFEGNVEVIHPSVTLAMERRFRCHTSCNILKPYKQNIFKRGCNKVKWLMIRILTTGAENKKQIWA
jgi:hypothetical protein